MNEPRVLLLMADEDRALRSMVRTVVGTLEEGQLQGRCHPVRAWEPLGGVVRESLAERPDRPPSGDEDQLYESLFQAPYDAVVAFDPVAAVLARRWALRTTPRPLTIGIVGALWPDPLWHRVPLDRLIVPDETVAQAFLESEYPAEALVPLGLGVCGRFGAGVKEGKPACRRALGLPLDTPTLLLVGESLWADDVLTWMRAAAQVGGDGDVRDRCLLVDVAGDRLALEAARALHDQLGLPGRVFGRVDEVGQLWGAADRILGVALNHLVTRALTYRCPYWAIRPADDRQRGIVRILRALDAGDAVPDPADLVRRLDADPSWTDSLDHGRLETVASPAVLPRISETITQMVMARRSA